MVVGDRPTPLSLFYSYSHKDDPLRDKLEEHLSVLKRQGIIASWHDRDIIAGEEWKGRIADHLEHADLILLLISPSFIASDYCWDREMARALERHDAGEACVIPVILRPCLWQQTPFARLQSAPKDARPVTQWPDADEAFLSVVTCIQQAADNMNRTRAARRDGRGGSNVATPSSALTDTSSTSTSASPVTHRRVDTSHVADLEVFQDVDAAWCPQMVALPMGEFLMGPTEQDGLASPPEHPRQHRVKIAYRVAVGRFPVTFAQYDYFCEQTGQWKPDDHGWGRGRRPVINVSWNDARAYCVWLTTQAGQPYRLPSEAEWEYACRAGTTTKFAYGDSLSTNKARYGLMAWSTVPVDSYQPNLWGLFDMHGNAVEWVDDVWHDDYAGAPDDGSAWLDGGVPDQRAARGGGFPFFDADGLASYARQPIKYMQRERHVGFRVARPI